MSEKKLKKGISLCMIVKNEERSLSRTLESVKGFVNEIIIVDTGSTDNTVEIANHFNARVYHFKWVDDFSKARNESIKYAKYSWILILDADEVIDEDSFKNVKKTLNNQKTPFALQCRIVSDSGESSFNESRVVRIFSNGFGLHFKNKVHEQLTSSIQKTNTNILRSNFKILHDGYNDMFVDQKKKQERNIYLLKKMINKEPDFYYWPYNLGISYMAINENEKAIKYLQKAYSEKLENTIKAAILNLLASIYRITNDWQKVYEHASNSLKIEQNQFLGYLLMIYYYNEKKEYNNSINVIDNVIGSYRKLIKDGSNLNNDITLTLPYLYRLKALALHGQKDYKSSYDYFKKVLDELKGSHSKNLLNSQEKSLFEDTLRSIIGCARDMEDPDKVISNLKIYLGINKNDFEGYKLLGEAYVIKNNYSEALKAYLQADSIVPNIFDVQKKIASMFTMLGNEKKAQEWLFKMAGISPNA